jgi:hypothetical protein
VFTGPLQMVRNGSKLVPHAVSAGSLLYAECRAIAPLSSLLALQGADVTGFLRTKKKKILILLYFQFLLNTCMQHAPPRHVAL